MTVKKDEKRKENVFTAILNSGEKNEREFVAACPTLRQLRRAKEISIPNDTFDESLNLVRLLLREVEGKKVAFRDLEGEKLEDYFNIKELSLIIGEFSSRMNPTEEEQKKFTATVRPLLE